MSPMLVTIIPFDYGFFCHQNWRTFKGITKIGDNFVENQCGLLYAILDGHKGPSPIISIDRYQTGAESGLALILTEVKSTFV